jgi:hypothetical protein
VGGTGCLSAQGIEQPADLERGLMVRTWQRRQGAFVFVRPGMGPVRIGRF